MKNILQVSCGLVPGWTLLTLAYSRSTMFRGLDLMLIPLIITSFRILLLKAYGWCKSARTECTCREETGQKRLFVFAFQPRRSGLHANQLYPVGNILETDIYIVCLSYFSLHSQHLLCVPTIARGAAKQMLSRLCT